MFQAAHNLFERIKVTTKLMLYGFLELQGDTNSTDASAISVVTGNTFLVSAGAETRTLANGIDGQVKTLIYITHVGNITVTPANLAAGTQITFSAAGACWQGVFKKGEWITMFVSTGAAVT